MANGFNHKDLILTLRKHFVKEFIKYLDPSLQNRISWTFPNKDFTHAYIYGLGDKQIKIINTEFIAGKKKINIDFLEDYKGNLTIVVNKKPVYLVKPMDRISIDLIKTLAKSIRSEI